MHVDDSYDPQRDMREMVASLVRKTRLTREMSMEQAAEAGGVSHVTWRRIENGLPVKPNTYRAVDKFLGAPTGTAALAVERGSLPPVWDSLLVAVTEPDSLSELQGEFAHDRFVRLTSDLLIELANNKRWPADTAADRLGLTADAWAALRRGEVDTEILLPAADRAFGQPEGTFSKWLESGEDPVKQLESKSMGITLNAGPVDVSPERYRLLSARERIAVQRALHENMAVSLDPGNVRKVLFDAMAAILHMLDDDELEGARAMVEQFSLLQGVISSYKVQGAISLAPNDGPYNEGNPWVTVRQNNWAFGISQDLATVVKQLMEEKAQQDHEEGPGDGVN